MSKVVRKVGRAVSRVVKGVANAVKKVAQSKLGKVLIAAAAIYFGGAALAGGLKGAAAGQGFLGSLSSGLSGAAQGIANAWTSLGTATTQAIGGNFTNAGNALSTGFQGGTATMAEGALVSKPLSIASAPIAPTPNALPSAPPSSGIDMNSVLGKTPPQASFPVNNIPAPPASPPSLAQGLIGAAKINAATQLVGGTLQGYGQQKAMEDQRAFEQQQAQAARDRYNANVGTNWWPSSDAGAPEGAPAPQPPGGAGLVGSAMNTGPAPGQSYQEYMDNLMKTYDPYSFRRQA